MKSVVNGPRASTADDASANRTIFAIDLKAIITALYPEMIDLRILTGNEVMIVVSIVIESDGV